MKGLGHSFSHRSSGTTGIMKIHPKIRLPVMIAVLEYIRLGIAVEVFRTLLPCPTSSGVWFWVKFLGL